MIQIKFFVTGKPAPQGSKRAFYNPHIGRSQIVESCKRVKPWRSDVRDACEKAIAAAGFKPPFIVQGPVRLSLAFYLARPKSHYGKRGLNGNARPFPTSKPDTVKLARAVEDAMKGMAWGDDSQIVQETIVKAYAEAGESEGVAVTVAAL